MNRVDAEKATAPEESIVYSGRRADGECELALAPWGSDEFIGSGSRIAAVTSDGRPQLFDLATGDAVWIGSAAGVPVDGDDQAVLVREQADRGALSLLDMATGTTRWTIPDPGLETTSASWRTIVTHSRVAVQGWDDEGPVTQVYDSTTGAEIGHYRGWLQAAGNDWVAVLLTSVRDRQLDFHD